MPGQYRDAETGLFYNYFRDYDPQTGRYAQSDPIGVGGLIAKGYSSSIGGAPVRAGSASPPDPRPQTPSAALLSTLATSDPHRLGGSRQNSYGYAYGAPLHYMDPTGEFGIGGVIVIGGVYIAAASYLSFFEAQRTFPAASDDKKRHCLASCALNKYLLWTGFPADAIGTTFEYSQKAGRGTFFDPADLEANRYGIGVSYSLSQLRPGSCEEACTSCPIK